MAALHQAATIRPPPSLKACPICGTTMFADSGPSSVIFTCPRCECVIASVPSQSAGGQDLRVAGLA